MSEEFINRGIGEDDIHFKDRSGWHNFQVVRAWRGEWRAFGNGGFIAAANTREDVIEKAKRILDR